MKALQQRTVPVELLLEASAKAVYPDRLEYLRHDQTETLSAATVIWTVGNMTHPLIKTLSVAEEGRDRQGRLLVTPTLQLPQFPDVFAAGDCSSMEDNPQPPTAQVAYQQGSTIAYNLRAIAEGKPLKPANVSMRGTLMKLGLGESAANLVNRFEIKGKVGHLIRQGTYLELLPTPVHNFKATTQWLTDEIFDSYARLTMNQRIASVLKWSSGTAAAIAIASSGLFAWRLAAPNQFNQALESTGIPALVDRLLLGQESSPDLLEELEKSN